MANAAVWRKMALIRRPVSCGQSDEYEAGTWLMVVGHLHSPSDPTEYSVLSVFLLTLGCWSVSTYPLDGWSFLNFTVAPFGCGQLNETKFALARWPLSNMEAGHVDHRFCHNYCYFNQLRRDGHCHRVSRVSGGCFHVCGIGATWPKWWLSCGKSPAVRTVCGRMPNACRRFYQARLQEGARNNGACLGGGRQGTTNATRQHGTETMSGR